MNPEAIADIVMELTVLPFFPSDTGARLAIVRMVGSMAHNEEQVRWLIGLMTSGAFAKWEGPGEMRAVFCMKFKPKDGIETTSAVFPDGLTREQLNPGKTLALPSAPLRQLEPGEPVSADAEMVALAATVATPAKRLPFVAVDTSVRRDESDYAALKRSIADFSERAIPTKVRAASEAEIEHLKALQDANRKESLPANEPITESDLVGVEQLKP